MNNEDRQYLLAERTFLKRMLVETPPNARLTRMSDEARLRKVEAQIAALPADVQTPAYAPDLLLPQSPGR